MTVLGVGAWRVVYMCVCMCVGRVCKTMMSFIVNVLEWINKFLCSTIC